MNTLKEKLERVAALAAAGTELERDMALELLREVYARIKFGAAAADEGVNAPEPGAAAEVGPQAEAEVVTGAGVEAVSEPGAASKPKPEPDPIAELIEDLIPEPEPVTAPVMSARTVSPDVIRSLYGSEEDDEPSAPVSAPVSAAEHAAAEDPAPEPTPAEGSAPEPATVIVSEEPVHEPAAAPVVEPEPEAVSAPEAESAAEPEHAPTYPQPTYPQPTFPQPQPETSAPAAPTFPRPVTPVIPPVQQSVSTPYSATLGDAIGAGNKTLGESLRSGERDMASHAAAAGTGGLRGAIGLNDRFLMVRDMFGGDAAAFDAAIERLDAFADLDDAVIWMRTNFDWSADTPGAAMLVALLERKLGR